jgi:flap endonuclease-1
MGIKNFRKFISSKIKNPIHQVKFDEINNKIKSVCIDINIFIYKYVTAIRKTGKDLTKDGKITSHLVGLKNQINLFKKLNIDIIYVFDGSAPKEKEKVLKERHNIHKKAIKKYKKTKSIQSYQQSFFITDKIIDTTIQFLKEKKVKYIYKENAEADMICAQLVKKKIVDCAYSTDFDILAFGAKCLIINIDYKKKYMEIISLRHILKSLKINYEQFVEMIIISGCDYCVKRDKITLNKAYNLTLENENIKLSKNEKRAKEIFMK